MRYVPFGKTGLLVSELGYGAWGIGGTGWVGADDQESLRALGRALELGVNFIDTAYGYGDGHSERLVGTAVQGAGETVYVASKVPPLNGQWPARPGVPAQAAFPGEWIVSCTERSLRNLGLETIDVQQLHVWSDEWLGQGDWLETVEQLKREGKIRFFGVSINDHQPGSALELVASGALDTIQYIYNIFDQSPQDALLPVVETANVGAIIRVPFQEGALTGAVRPETTFPEGDFRTNYFRGERRQEIWTRVQAIAADLDVPVDRLAEIALRFCLSQDISSTTIPGMRSTANVERNVQAADAGPLDPDQLAVLKRHRWVTSFY